MKAPSAANISLRSAFRAPSLSARVRFDHLAESRHGGFDVLLGSASELLVRPLHETVLGPLCLLIGDGQKGLGHSGRVCREEVSDGFAVLFGLLVDGVQS